MDRLLARAAPWVFGAVAVALGLALGIALWPEPAAGTVRGGMAWIPSGAFDMGSPFEEFADSRPVRKVALDGFWIDTTEVTNAEFTRFVEATGYVTDAEKPQASPEPGRPGLPQGPSSSPRLRAVAPASTTIGSGGASSMARNGGTRSVPKATSRARTIAPWCR